MLKIRNQGVVFRILLLLFSVIMITLIFIYKNITDLTYVGMLLLLFLDFLIEKYLKWLYYLLV